MKTWLEFFTPKKRTEEEQRQVDLRQVRVRESLVKLSYLEETFIEKETCRFLTRQRRQEKLARRHGLPLPPTPGHIAYGVYC